jgi:hypothetical protein
MTTIARAFASIPTRSAAATWQAIADLIAPDPQSVARRDLDAVRGIACSVITDEALRFPSPAVIHGVGPLLRVYGVYGNEALEGEDVNEEPLTFVPTDGDWHMSLPCPEDDLSWVTKALQERSARIRARVIGGDVEEDRQAASGTSRGQSPIVDRDAFFRR